MSSATICERLSMALQMPEPEFANDRNLQAKIAFYFCNPKMFADWLLGDFSSCR